MKQLLVWFFFFSLICCCQLHLTASIDESARSSLISFLGTLSNNNDTTTSSVLNWSVTSDPCWGEWARVGCDRKNASVTQLYLDRLNLWGTLTIAPLCRNPTISKSLSVVVLDGNNITGEIPQEISDCNQLTRFHVSGNRLSGDVPDSFVSLKNIKKLDFSFNNFSGRLPDLGRVSGLRMFRAQNNRFSGDIPEFDFSNIGIFNVSYNNLTGRIPKSARIYFGSDSFVGNPLLCGVPLPNPCPKRDNPSTGRILLYIGYVLLGLVLIGLIAHKILKGKPDPVTMEASSGFDKSSISGPEINSMPSLVSSPVVNGLQFEDLLRAPAELMGRGNHGSLYKVVCGNGTTFAVKRIKNWAVSSEDFKRRMQTIGEMKHRNVLPASAFYSSTSEKLLVYEFRPNGSLFRLLHGIRMDNVFEWVTRLNVAASVAEALTFMHQNLGPDIPHGNLKSSNILFDKNMDPCISEYGLIMSGDNKSPDTPSSEVATTVEADIYGFGVILLELLTGKLVHNEFDLTKWVHSVAQAEWTAEVFDESLIQEGASEERMMKLLQVAVKCVGPAAEARPRMSEVAAMINSLREDEDASVFAYEPLHRDDRLINSMWGGSEFLMI